MDSLGQSPRSDVQTNNQSAESTTLQVTLTRGEVQGKRVAKRKFQVNGVARRKKDFLGNFSVVSFIPEDMSLLTGSKSKRRRYLDETLIQIDTEYIRAMGDYEKALKQKNALLDQISEGRMSADTLEYYNMIVLAGLYSKRGRNLLAT